MTFAAENKAFNADINKRFLAATDSKTKNAIVQAIARHYGISADKVIEEITGDDAEHILDYMTEPERSAAHIVMKRHGF